MIEGDAAQQKQLKSSPWNANKIIRKGIKHLLFYVMSFVIANFFLSYIIGVKELWKIITEPVSQHFGGLTAILIFSGVFYGVYAYFREQACTVVCPYGRLQSVLLDKNSMIVAYDYKRGEPRGKYDKRTERTIGDCIDCFQCVRVCPTGIDIRNGTQLECVGCTACIDACNSVMDKIEKPRGLVRYASESGIANHEKLHYTTRMKMYTLLLGILLSILSFLLLTRKDVDATIMRTPGQMFQLRGTDSISNLYNIKVANKTIQDVPLTIKVEDMKGAVQVIGADHLVHVKKEGQGASSFFIILPKSSLHARKTTVKLGLYEGDKKLDELKTSFLGPVTQ
jgi:cytochrome c oxidase accessory protein FixG